MESFIESLNDKIFEFEESLFPNGKQRIDINKESQFSVTINGTERVVKALKKHLDSVLVFFTEGKAEMTIFLTENEVIELYRKLQQIPKNKLKFS